MSINLAAQKEQVMKEKVNFNKSLTPRTEVCTILGITYKHNDYNNQDGYDVSVQLEGKDITALGFEGFFIDKDNEALGRHKGPTGWVKLSQYTFVTKEWPAQGNKPANIVDRDAAIIQEIGKIAKIVNKVDELYTGEVDNIEVFMDKASTVLKGTQINVTIGGREYEKDGYTRYELFLIRPGKDYFNMEEPGKTPSLVEKFDPSKHIIKKKATSATVSEFEIIEPEFSV